MEKNKLSKKYILLIMIIICLIGVSISSYKIFFWTSSDVENKNIQDELKEYVNLSIETNNTNETKSGIDFESLKKQNSDTVAYLKVNNTKIDYVVVKTKDNDYYLHHNFKKKSNVAGWVFADYHNKFDGTDRNIIVYGHNMKNGSMFGTLKKTFNKIWLKNESNHIITFVTNSGVHEYEVFSVYSVPAETYYISTEFSSDKDFYKFIKTLRNRSIYKFGVKLKETDKILTLSTCNSKGKNRTVLHARLVDE